jgi:hypothetical protein
MADSTARQFAELALASFAFQGTFRVEFASLEELDACAAAFRELGCTVAHLPEMRLAVTCPPGKQ